MSKEQWEGRDGPRPADGAQTYDAQGHVPPHAAGRDRGADRAGEGLVRVPAAELDAVDEDREGRLGAGRDRIGLAARGFHLVDRLLPALADADVETFVDQADAYAAKYGDRRIKDLRDLPKRFNCC